MYAMDPAGRERDVSCHFLVSAVVPATSRGVKEALEGGDPVATIAALKNVILLLLNGEKMPQLFITIVRYVLPSKNRIVQKLLLLYLEMVEKTDFEGELLPELILVCQHLRSHLQHANVFVCGVTLRFLCRIREAELVEPLIPAVLINLEHRHAYVRRNAVLAVGSFYQLPGGDLLLPGALEMVEALLRLDTDPSTRRHALVLLARHAPERVARYLFASAEALPACEDLLQLAALELLPKVCATTGGHKGQCFQVLLSLMASRSSAVRYQCAAALLALTAAPAAVRAAVVCYCTLLVRQGDNNVKLIVLQRLQEVKEGQREAVRRVVLEVLRVLPGSQDLDVRRGALTLCSDLVTSDNVDEVMAVLRREAAKLQNSKDWEQEGQYRQLLVQEMHSVSLVYPHVVPAVVGLLIDFLRDPCSARALRVAAFVRQVMETHPQLRPTLLEELRNSLHEVRVVHVLARCLWMLGEYSATSDDITAALDTIKAGLGPLPLLSHDGGVPPAAVATTNAAPVAPAAESRALHCIGGAVQRPTMLAGGTRALQMAAGTEELGAAQLSASDTYYLRRPLMSGDFHLGAVLANTLTKLVLRLGEVGVAGATLHRRSAEAMLCIVSILRLGESPALPSPLDQDSAGRMQACLALLARPRFDLAQVWLHDCRASFLRLHEKAMAVGRPAQATLAAPPSQPDDLIDFHLLKPRRGLTRVEREDRIASDLRRAKGHSSAAVAQSFTKQVVQLMGMSDPLYVEAVVTVQRSHAVVDMTVINRSPQPVVVGSWAGACPWQERRLMPGESDVLHYTLEASLGSFPLGITYEGPGGLRGAQGAGREVLASSLLVSVDDYIRPASCCRDVFCTRWAEFDWENVVPVMSRTLDVEPYLRHIADLTSTQCLTPPEALQGECGILSAILYGQTVCGEEVLLHVCIEKAGNGTTQAMVRMRAKEPELAQALGDRLLMSSRQGE